MMEMKYIQIVYTNRKSSFVKTAIVAVQTEDGMLITEYADIAKEKLEKRVGEKVNMLNFNSLGCDVIIVE